MQNIYIIILISLLFTTNIFASTVATITALRGQATIQKMDKSIEAKIGLKLEKNDTIQTMDNTKIQIIFTDNTIISIGKNSNFSIKDYLYEEEAPIATFSLLSGAARIITGKIAKIAPQKFKIQTKTATIGIRGTNFTVVANLDNSYQVYCTYGEIYITINNRTFNVEKGYFIFISPQGAVEIKAFSPLDLRKMKNEKFSLILNDKTEKTDEMKVLNNSDKENNEYLDITLETSIDMQILSISDVINTDIQNTTFENLTNSAIIDSYSMKEAIYGGIYTTEFSTGSLYTSGDVLLNIDFGQDTAKLGLGSYSNEAPVVWYNFLNVNSNTISGLQEGGDGSISAKFYGKTGNTIKGSFDFMEKIDNTQQTTAKGNFVTTSAQELK